MRLSLRVLAVAGLMTAGAAVCGCGLPPITQAGCAISYKLNVTPMAATADHNTLAPANQVQFTGLNSMSVPAGCAVAAVMVREYATWDNPDPVDIDINSAGNPANGSAVCKGSTSGPVTLTGHFSYVSTTGDGAGPATASVQLTCK